MTFDSSEALVDTVRQLGLLEPDQLTEILEAYPGYFADPRALVQFMLHQNYLTSYQANRLMQGRGQELVLGQYILLERLGQGGMGQVFKARHRFLERIVALKILRRDLLSNPEAIRRFRREIQLASQLSHPNVVLAFDADQVGETHFFVMEYIEGIDLAKLVHEQGQLPVAHACDYIRQAALGLQHAHDRGLVHRDIKPSNLLLSGTQETRSSGVVKILDMGLARLEQPTSDDSSLFLSRERMMIGTVDFMAPEQADDAQSVDGRADLYSLGCTLYYLLTTKTPFPATSPAEQIFKHRYEPPPPLARERPDLPPMVVAVVYKLLAKKPEKRYQNSAELVAVLGSLRIPTAWPVDGSAAFAEQPIALAMPVESGAEVEHILPASTGGSDGSSVGLGELGQPGSQVGGVLRGPGHPLDAVAFAQDGKMLAHGRLDGIVRLWDLSEPDPQVRWDLEGHKDQVAAVAFAPDDLTLVSGDNGGRVIWWEVTSGTLIREWRLPRAVRRIIFAPDGRHVAVVSDRGVMYILGTTQSKLPG